MHTTNDISSNQIWQWIKEPSVAKEIEKVICPSPNQNYAVIKTTLRSRRRSLNDLQREPKLHRANVDNDRIDETVLLK